MLQTKINKQRIYETIRNEDTNIVASVLNTLTVKDIEEMETLTKYGYPPAEVLLKKGVLPESKMRLLGRVTTEVMKELGYSKSGTKSFTKYGGCHIFALFKKD